MAMAEKSCLFTKYYCFLDRKVIEYRMLRVYFWEYALRTVIRIYYTAEAVEKIKRKQE